MKKHHSLISFLLLMIFVVVGAQPVATTFAQQSQKPTVAKSQNDVAGRIRRIENGLLPAVIVKGEPNAAMKLADRMQFYKTPGVSVAVINNGKIEWARGYGVKKAGTDEKVTPETLFQAASISKPVAAVAALRLVEKGKLSLDADVNQKLVGWKVPENEFTKTKKVTLRETLSHNAGLTVHGFGGYAASEQVPTLPQILNGEKPANSAPVRVDVAPGSVWRYSGGGFTVLQLLMQDATAKPFPELMRETVLSRIGMRHSSYEQPLPTNLQPQAAAGHNSDGKTIVGDYHVYPEMAAAGLWTTPSDLALFAIEIQKSLAGKSNKVLSQKMTEQLLTVQKGEWGLGLRLSGAGNAARFAHNGANDGFQCVMIAYNRTGQGAVVMTNSDNGGQLAREILFAVAKEYGWADFAPVVKIIAKVDAKIYDAYVGQYELTPGLVVSLKRENDKLFAAVAGQKSELLPESETVFFTLSNSTVEFVKDESGEVTHLLLNKTNRARKIK